MPTEISDIGDGFFNCKLVSASGVDTYSYSLSSVKTAGASDYLYVKTQSFTTTGHSFDWENCPYHTGSDKYSGWTKYCLDSHRSPWDNTPSWAGAGDPDNKIVLDPEDDAAHVNWGGTWRMPSPDEWIALYQATYQAWDGTDKGCYVYVPNPASDAGKYNSGTGTYDKSNALLFFPAAGIVSDTTLFGLGSYTYFWSNAHGVMKPQDAFYFEVHSFRGISGYDRTPGLPVRPLSD